MLKEKLSNISVAQHKVNDLRTQYYVLSKNFRCYQHNAKGDIACAPNLYPYMVHPMFCKHYYDNECPILDCKSYDWNKNYFALRKSLRDARRMRNRTILNLFGIKTK